MQGVFHLDGLGGSATNNDNIIIEQQNSRKTEPLFWIEPLMSFDENGVPSQTHFDVVFNRKCALSSPFFLHRKEMDHVHSLFMNFFSFSFFSHTLECRKATS